MDNRYCPEHDTTLTNSEAWSRCPIATEGDPIDMETCHHFAQEMERRIKDVTENGNYFQTLPRDDVTGEWLVQEYRNHEPYGEPRPIGG